MIYDILESYFESEPINSISSDICNLVTDREAFDLVKHIIKQKFDQTYITQLQEFLQEEKK